MSLIVQRVEHYQQLNGMVGSAAKCGEGERLAARSSAGKQMPDWIRA